MNKDMLIAHFNNLFSSDIHTKYLDIDLIIEVLLEYIDIRETF